MDFPFPFPLIVAHKNRKIVAMLFFSLVFCIALVHSATITNHGSRPDVRLDIMRSSYKNAKIIQPGNQRFHASEVSTPNISTIALHTAASENARNSTKLGVTAEFCTETRLGRPDYSSCVEALHLMPRDERLATYERHRPDLFPRDHSSPHRVLSSQLY